MSLREKRLVLLTLVLLIILFAKSLMWDSRLGDLTPEQEQFVAVIEEVLDSDYRSKLPYKWGVLRLAVIDIELASERVLLDVKGEGAAPIFPYIAKIRRYLFQIVPIADFKMMK